MLRHSRAHHRHSHRRHQIRRLRLLHTRFWYAETPPPPTFYDAHLAGHRLLGLKHAAARRQEEHRFRQAVRRALIRGDEALPILKPEWAD